MKKTEHKTKAAKTRDVKAALWALHDSALRENNLGVAYQALREIADIERPSALIAA